MSVDRNVSISCMVLAWLLAGCFDSQSPQLNGSAPEFHDFFDTSDSFELEEMKEDPIGDIESLLETRRGDLVIGDAILPRVRRYGPQGQLLASFGSSGEGPGEFRGVGGLVELSDGRLAVFDPGLARATLLTDSLGFLSILHLQPRPLGAAIRMGDSILLVTSPGSRSSALTLMTQSWQALWSVTPPLESVLREHAYWGSMARTEMAASSTALALATSFLYPIHLFDRSGTLVDSLTAPPPSFRPVPDVSPGTFSGPGSGKKIAEWLARFDVISRLEVLNDTLLVVVHGQLTWTSTGRTDREDRHLDLYHLPSRQKVVEDIRLPAGSTVLGAGEALYLLVKEPPSPWTVLRATLRRPDG